MFAHRFGGQALPPKGSASSSAESKLSEFRFVKKLGKGAYGEVFLVERKADDDVYAMKKVGIRRMSHREIQDALNEIRLLASVRHASIINWFEAFVVEKTMDICIVMEYADGGDLSDKIKQHARSRKPIDEATIWSYAIQLLDALAHLHSKKILHRDLKTANCFLTKDGQVKLGDFNVSKLTKHGLQAMTQIGTPYYMSPEIFIGRRYDDKSDMWSVGCILYELAALRVPFDAKGISELSRKVQSGRYLPISNQYSQELRQFIGQLLRVNPRERPCASTLLNSPIIQKKRGEVRPHVLIGIEDNPSQQNLLSTIAAPRNLKLHPHGMRQLTERLPEPRYDKPQIEEPLPEVEEGKSGMTKEPPLPIAGIISPPNYPRRGLLQGRSEFVAAGKQLDFENVNAAVAVTESEALQDPDVGFGNPRSHENPKYQIPGHGKNDNPGRNSSQSPARGKGQDPVTQNKQNPRITPQRPTPKRSAASIIAQASVARRRAHTRAPQSTANSRGSSRDQPGAGIRGAVHYPVRSNVSRRAAVPVHGHVRFSGAGTPSVSNGKPSNYRQQDSILRSNDPKRQPMSSRKSQTPLSGPSSVLSRVGARSIDAPSSQQVHSTPTKPAQNPRSFVLRGSNAPAGVYWGGSRFAAGANQRGGLRAPGQGNSSVRSGGLSSPQVHGVHQAPGNRGLYGYARPKGDVRKGKVGGFSTPKPTWWG